jgi:hypothetical protein
MRLRVVNRVSLTDRDNNKDNNLVAAVGSEYCLLGSNVSFVLIGVHPVPW